MNKTTLVFSLLILLAIGIIFVNFYLFLDDLQPGEDGESESELSREFSQKDLSIPKDSPDNSTDNSYDRAEGREDQKDRENYSPNSTNSSNPDDLEDNQNKKIHEHDSPLYQISQAPKHILFYTLEDDSDEIETIMYAAVNISEREIDLIGIPVSEQLHISDKGIQPLKELHNLGKHVLVKYAVELLTGQYPDNYVRTNEETLKNVCRQKNIDIDNLNVDALEEDGIEDELKDQIELDRDNMMDLFFEFQGNVETDINLEELLEWKEEL
ncbi:hypothetical protein [Natranaerobius thermophilus]|uniref:Uncharacterized protein n=1 Tax=Natranaerobius thermophilus (strain ATCC BAA-1301 / DSM 18059 / JW/NM-WN-LF) TaxID=457570 RepID=B2A854_NATTJ|nr:hypothetical protein [Natranaerobius thermophilus]ACB85822.1 hypothetical protein Nther_2256 [Natranaerobius thermophilus JW/NM-WN-LF]